MSLHFRDVIYAVALLSIVPSSLGAQQVPPDSYAARTDRDLEVKPPLPTLGAAGTTIIDPTFGSTILRVTDLSIQAGSPNTSYHVSSQGLATWNSSSTMFFVLSGAGTILPFTFDGTTMTASRLGGSSGLTLAFYGEPQFSAFDPNVIFGVSPAGTRHTVQQYNFSSGYSNIVDLDTVVPGLPVDTYAYVMATGGSPASENLTIMFGGYGQNDHHYMLWTPRNDLSARKLLDTTGSTLNGAATSIPLNFHLHGGGVDKSGRFVTLVPTDGEVHGTRCASPYYVWDTATDAITAFTTGQNQPPGGSNYCDGGTAMIPGGHATQGYGVQINQDCCTANHAYEAVQWQFRSLAAPASTRDVVTPYPDERHWMLADHQSWNNAQSDRSVPFISSVYRTSEEQSWRAWDDEIIAVQSNAPSGTRTMVWRFAHHRSVYTGFWTSPIAVVSPNGQYVMFHSNWEGALGTDAGGQVRTDVFIVHLEGASTQGSWTGNDIGAVGMSGGFSVSNGTYTVGGAGAGTWGTADAFQFVHQPLAGVGEIVARVVSMQNTNTFAKAGVMIRETLDADSAHVILDLRPTNDLEFMIRPTSGAATTFLATAVQVPPTWLKLRRTGTSVSGYVSADGVTWTLVGTTTLNIVSDAHIGLAVTSADVSQVNTSVFDNITVSTGSSGLPNPWATQDVGSVGQPGSASYTNGTFTLTGSGTDIWGWSDSFRYVFRPLNGNGTIIARVASMQSSAYPAKAGVMIRETLTGTAANTMLALQANGTIELITRHVADGWGDVSATSTQVPPTWLKLVRAGTTVTGYVSADGSSWSLVGTVTLDVAASVYVGIAECAVNNSGTHTSAFDNVSVSSP